MNARDRIIKATKKTSIRRFAAAAGISHARIIQILAGDRITYDMAGKLAVPLRCSAKSLYEPPRPKSA